MKLLVTTIYYPPRLGGIENHVYYLCRGLVKEGNHVSVITSRTEAESPAREREERYEVDRLPLPGRNAIGWIVNAIASLPASIRAGKDWVATKTTRVKFSIIGPADAPYIPSTHVVKGKR